MSTLFLPMSDISSGRGFFVLPPDNHLPRFTKGLLYELSLPGSPPHSYFVIKTWEMGWPGSVGSHCQLPRSRHGGPDIFSCKHAILARWDEKIITAHVFVYPLTKILNRPAHKRFNMATNINMATSVDISYQSANKKYFKWNNKWRIWSIDYQTTKCLIEALIMIVTSLDNTKCWERQWRNSTAAVMKQTLWSCFR